MRSSNQRTNSRRSMSASDEVRFTTNSAGWFEERKERMEEKLSSIDDVDLLVIKSYLRDVYKLIDYEKKERIVMQNSSASWRQTLSPCRLAQQHRQRREKEDGRHRLQAMSSTRNVS